MKISIAVLFLVLFSGMAPAKESLEESIQLYGKGEFRQAAQALGKLSQASPADPETRFWLGKTYLKLREWAPAVREMEKAVALQPSSARYHLWLGRACGERASHAFFTTAFSLARRVIKEFETARNLAPKDAGIRFDLLEFYLQAPGVVGGGRDKAEEEARTIARLDPVKGYAARATIFRKDKKWDKAKAELLQATVEHPQNADVFKDLADYLLDRQDYEGSLDYGRKALALNQKSKRTRLLVAVAQTSLKRDLEAASRSLQELAAGPLFDEDPSFEEAHYWLGENYLAQGDRARARDCFKSALAFNPEYSKAKNALSKIK